MRQRRLEVQERTRHGPIWTLAVACMVTACIITPRTASACDCLRLKPLPAQVRSEVPVIFDGTVVEIIERNEHSTTTYDGGAKTSVRPLDRRVVFQVSEGWRGVTREKFDVGAEVSDCMFPFEIGRRYVVFAHKDARGRAWTSICTRTIQYDKAEDIVRTLGTPSFKPSAANP
jgi:hypothetical protein